MRLDLESMLRQLYRLNGVFPKFQLDAQTAAALAHEYREALDGFDADAVDGAVSLWLREGDRFPVPLRLRERATRWMTVNRPQLMLPRFSGAADADHCPCGCGGARWARQLFDTAGVLRRFPDIIDADGAPPSAGPLMTRDQMACRLDPRPLTAAFLRTDGRGIPVFQVPR